MAIEIERINAKFEGEFKFRGKARGVPFTLPGDLVSFKVIKKGRGFRMEVEEIEKAESYPEDLELRTPFCEYFRICGGCRAQNFSYDTQVRLKVKPVQDKMQEFFGLNSEFLACPTEQNYRNRMDFVVDGNIVGLRPAGDHSRFVDIQKCMIQKEPSNRALEIVQTLLKKYPASGAVRNSDNTLSGGPLKYVTVRTGEKSGVLSLTLNQDMPANEDYLHLRTELEEILAGEVGFEFSLVECSGPANSEVSNPAGGKPLLGEGHYRERLGGLEFEVPYDSFFQPNPQAFDQLLEWCFAQLEARERTYLKAGRLLDLYSGTGVLSSIITARYPEVFNGIKGYDFIISSIERAAKNLNHYEGEISFEARDLNSPPEDLLEGSALSLIIVDPPRAGMGSKLRKMIRRNPLAPILYISCNPGSQIPDLQELSKTYTPVAACITDCFPQTPHLEQAVLLEPKIIEEEAKVESEG